MKEIKILTWQEHQERAGGPSGADVTDDIRRLEATIDALARHIQSIPGYDDDEFAAARKPLMEAGWPFVAYRGRHRRRVGDDPRTP
ncbi:MAG: hypothetical protein WD906_00985 [Anaerolineales bacterium]